jgi:hypothetical protein
LLPFRSDVWERPGQERCGTKTRCRVIAAGTANAAVVAENGCGGNSAKQFEPPFALQTIEVDVGDVGLECDGHRPLFRLFGGDADFMGQDADAFGRDRNRTRHPIDFDHDSNRSMAIE